MTQPGLPMRPRRTLLPPPAALLAAFLLGLCFTAIGEQAPAQRVGEPGAIAPLAPITARGGDLFRGGERFRVFGLQNLEHPFERAFYREGSPAQRAAMAARIGAVRDLGANTLRIHLQLFDFVDGDGVDALRVRARAFDNLGFLLDTARREGLYLLVSANNAWFPRDIPAWYDRLAYRERWEVQAFFLEHLARATAAEPAVLAIELMSEPVILREDDALWYNGEFLGYHFVQAIARGVAPEDAKQVGRDWIERLGGAIRAQDPQRLITVGTMGTYHEGPLGVRNIAPLLDLLSPHIYPQLEDPDFALRTARRWAGAGKPVVVGETHLFSASEGLFRDFLAGASPLLDGFISMYFGTGPDAFGNYIAEQTPEVLDVHRLNLRVLLDMRATILEPVAGESPLPVH